MANSEKLLIISPSFHGYCYSIADGFSQLGYETQVHRYDAFDNVPAKLKNKILFEFPGKVGINSDSLARQHASAGAIKAFQEMKPDKLIVIKGDTLNSNFWEIVERAKIPFMLWLYDDFAKHQYAPGLLHQMPAILSYARAETEMFREQGLNAHFIPNGYDPQLANLPQHRTQEVVFVGSRYQNRVEILEKLHRADVPVRAYGRGWSHHWYDRLRMWEWHRPDLASERDITLKQAYQVQAEAAAALNIHIDQRGLSMRTFEVPGMNGLQIVDREDVEEFYEIDREVLVFRSQDELLELCQRIFTDTKWSEAVREAGQKRSISEHTFYHRAQAVEKLWN